MAHNLHLKVIAEGVEDDLQLEFLHAKGCDEAQGYLFSRPLAADAFIEWFVKYEQNSRTDLNLVKGVDHVPL